MKAPLTLVAMVTLLAAYAQLPQLHLVQIATGFASPVDIKNCGDNRLFVVEQKGTIRVMDKAGNIQATPFLDITSKVQSGSNEQGLLGLAFSPNYKQDGYFYINYITGSGNGSTVIARYSVNATDSSVADPASEKVLLTFTQPFTNHNGGGLAFGKDGYLYDSQGDGGSSNDPQGNGQSRNTYHGKILRIDVSDPDTTYTIPADNPFVSNAAVSRKEIWAYGLRNPWRISFDRLTGDFWLADVGQDALEEIDFHDVDSAAGQNFGWRCLEGTNACPGCNQTGCAGLVSALPVFQYSQSFSGSCSVTGGYVYRGARFAALFGRYMLADYCSGIFFSVTRRPNGTFDADTLQDFTNFQITSFGEDSEGELYVLFRGNASNPAANPGKVFHLTDTSGCIPVAMIASVDSTQKCGPVILNALHSDSLSYEWYGANGAISGANSSSYHATATGWYKVQVSAGAGCMAVSDSLYVDISQPQVLTPNLGQTNFCRYDVAASLSNYVSPAGGMYTGIGVSSQQFNPAQVADSSNVVYTYTNTAGCISSFGFVLKVSDTTALQLEGDEINFCINGGPVDLNAYINPKGGVFSGAAIVDSIFTPANAGSLNQVNYSYTNAGGCISAVKFTMVAKDTIVVQLTNADTVVCLNAAPVNLHDYVNPAGGMFTGNAVGNGFFQPGAAGQVTAIAYRYTNQDGCISGFAFNLHLKDTIALQYINAGDTFCLGAGEVNLNTYVFPTGGIFNGIAVADTIFTPSEAGAEAVVDVSYSYINLQGCTSHLRFTLVVNDTVELQRSIADAVFCVTEPPVSFASYVSPSGGIFTGAGINGTMFTPAQAIGTNTITYTRTTPAGCVAQTKFNITVGDTVPLQLTDSDMVFCAGDQLVFLNGYVLPAGGNFSGAAVSSNLFDPSIAADTNAVVYEYTSQFGCITQLGFNLYVGDTVAITVQPVDTTFCLSEVPVPLAGYFVPVSGVYSGTGITADSVFNPSVAGSGQHTIAYTYTSPQGCASIVSLLLQVGNEATITGAPIVTTYCSNDIAFSLDSVFAPAGGVYSGNAVAGNRFNPAIALVGNNSVYYSYTNQYGCVSTDSFQYQVVLCNSISEPGSQVFQITPNPSEGIFTLHLDVEKTMHAELLVTDAMGRIIMQRGIEAITGSNGYAIDMGNCTAGIYQLHVKSETLSISGRLFLR